LQSLTITNPRMRLQSGSDPKMALSYRLSPWMSSTLLKTLSKQVLRRAHPEKRSLHTSEIPNTMDIESGQTIPTLKHSRVNLKEFATKSVRLGPLSLRIGQIIPSSTLASYGVARTLRLQLRRFSKVQSLPAMTILQDVRNEVVQTFRRQHGPLQSGCKKAVLRLCQMGQILR
jgi:hypothetical protein